MNRCLISAWLATCVFSLCGASLASDIQLTEVQKPQIVASTALKRDQLPHSRVERGTKDIAAVWLALPTDRYRHGVLGDGLEASRLVVETPDGKEFFLDLPENRVFEDLSARLVDLDRDGHDEIVVVETDVNEGAALAVYGLVDNKIVLHARTQFIGRAYRWLNPLGAGDFDGDGKLEIALIATPHIGGVMRLYRYSSHSLVLFAELDGVSTHRMGSTELGLGQAVPGQKRDRLLVPDQAQRSLQLIEWTAGGLRVIARASLPARLRSSLSPSGYHKWRFELDDGRHFEARIND